MKFSPRGPSGTAACPIVAEQFHLFERDYPNHERNEQIPIHGKAGHAFQAYGLPANERGNGLRLVETLDQLVHRHPPFAAISLKQLSFPCIHLVIGVELLRSKTRQVSKAWESDGLAVKRPEAHFGCVVVRDFHLSFPSSGLTRAHFVPVGSQRLIQEANRSGHCTQTICGNESRQQARNKKEKTGKTDHDADQFPATIPAPTRVQQHPTSNIQRRTLNSSANRRSLRRSKFDVGRSISSLGPGARSDQLQFRCFNFHGGGLADEIEPQQHHGNAGAFLHPAFQPAQRAGFDFDRLPAVICGARRTSRSLSSASRMSPNCRANDSWSGTSSRLATKSL